METILCLLMITGGAGIIFGAWIGSEVGDAPVVVGLALAGGICGVLLGVTIVGLTWVMT